MEAYKGFIPALLLFDFTTLIREIHGLPFE
jgi:hypothetical protein